MTAHIHALRPAEPPDAPDVPGVAFNPWDYGHALARAGVPGKVGPGPCAVLHTIASHANKQAQAEVGMTCIARESGLSRRAVINAIARLIECRAIGRLWRRDDQTMVNETNLYTVLPVEGIVAHPGPARRREQARALARSRSTGSDATVTTGECDGPSDATVTTLVTVRAPKASPISNPLLSIPTEEHLCAASAAPPATTASNGHSKRRERACRSPEEEQQREELMQIFNDRLRPIDCKEWGRCRREMLDGLREHGFEHMAGCMRAMSTARRFVLQSYVTPITVVRNVLSWEDAGRPRQWVKVEEFAAHKVQQQGGAR